jgi:hypothetical protein
MLDIISQEDSLTREKLRVLTDDEMSSTMTTSGVGKLGLVTRIIIPSLLILLDMNDQWNLSIYAKLIRFQVDQTKEDMLVRKLDRSKYKALYHLACGLDLECEFSIYPNTVRITRSKPSISDQNNSTSPNICTLGVSLQVVASTEVVPDYLNGLSIGPVSNESVQDQINHVSQRSSVTQTRASELGSVTEESLTSPEFDFGSFISFEEQQSIVEEVPTNPLRSQDTLSNLGLSIGAPLPNIIHFVDSPLVDDSEAHKKDEVYTTTNATDISTDLSNSIYWDGVTKWGVSKRKVARDIEIDWTDCGHCFGGHDASPAYSTRNNAIGRH